MDQNNEIDIQINSAESEIRELISSLDAPTSDIGDWKIIKCYEAKLCNIDMPYDLEYLMSQRQKVRDRINELQQLIESLREGEK